MKRYFIVASFALSLIIAYADIGAAFAAAGVTNAIAGDNLIDRTITVGNGLNSEVDRTALPNGSAPNRRLDYGFSVAGIPITSENASNITGNNIAGSITYDVCNRVLILNNAIINVSLNIIPIVKSQSSSMLQGIELIGNNVLLADAPGMDIAGNSLTIYSKSNGKMSVTSRTSHGIKASGRFLVNNCEITVKGRQGGITGGQQPIKPYMEVVNAMITTEGGAGGCLENFKEVTLRDCALTLPLNAYINGSIVDADGNMVLNRAVIEPVYGLKVAGVYATPRNASNITGNGINGHVSYDKATQTLTLSNAQITASGKNNAIKMFYNDNSDVKNINLIGSNTLNADTVALEAEPALTISGSGKLSVNSSNDIAIHLLDTTLLINRTEVVAVGKTYGIKGNKALLSSAQLIIDDSKVSAKGDAGSICRINKGIALRNCNITRPAGATYNNGSVMSNNTVVNSEVLIERVSTDTEETPFDEQSSSLVVYPTPATDILTIETEAAGAAITLTDLIGRTVMTATATGGKTVLKLSKLSAGTYMVRVGNKTGKVIKE